jgi:hypothetical protein
MSGFGHGSTPRRIGVLLRTARGPFFLETEISFEMISMFECLGGLTLTPIALADLGAVSPRGIGELSMTGQ